MRSLATITPAALALLASVAVTGLASAAPTNTAPSDATKGKPVEKAKDKDDKAKASPKKGEKSHKKIHAHLKGKKHDGKDVAAAVDKAEKAAATKVDLVESKDAKDAKDAKVELPEAKSDAKADVKADAKKLEAKIDAKKAEKADEEPPPELTGALPQAKLATKKSKEKSELASKESKEIASKKEETSSKDAEVKSLKFPVKGKALPPLPASNKAKTSALGAKVPLHDKSIGFDKKVRSCLHPAVSFSRLGQPNETPVVLTTCAGSTAPGALDTLSILARPYDRPEPEAARFSLLMTPGITKSARAKLAMTPSPDVAPGIRRLDAGIVERLQAIADHFPGKTITVVSGYRPQSKGSPHAAARALDMRIDGVTNEVLVAFCKTLADTGCGYYPNSSFVHVDVRPAGTGHVHWIDVSGPGEKPVYVKTWPLPAADASLPPLPSVAGKGADEAPEALTPKGTTSASTTDEAMIGPVGGSEHGEEK